VTGSAATSDPGLAPGAIGASADAGVSEPVTGTTLTGAAGANALLCLLAQASVDPTQAMLSTLCDGAPSTADGSLSLGAANAPTGTRVTSDAAVRAAICLLAFVASPLPGSVDTSDLADASLSTLCGSGPSTAGGSGDVAAVSDRTGTSVDAGPAVALAMCLLANGTVGDPTVAQLSSTCASTLGGTPSTAGGSAPIALSDATTGTTADLAPAASAAACILANALVNAPASVDEPVAAADLSTACGTSGSATPTVAGVATPADASTSGGTGGDVAPAVSAALCILANAELALGGSSLAVADACAGTAASPSIPVTAAAAAAAPPEEPGLAAPAIVAGVEAAPQTSAEVPAGTTALGAPSGLAGLAGLPSTSTVAIAGLGLLVAGAATLAALARRRRG
jgi:hypothetical protein